WADYGFALVEAVERMQRAHREFGKRRVDQQRKLDLRGGDGADIDGALGERAERLRGDAGVAAHADADDGNLGDVGGAVEPGVTDGLLGLGDDIEGALIIGGRHGEG